VSVSVCVCLCVCLCVCACVKLLQDDRILSDLLNVRYVP